MNSKVTAAFSLLAAWALCVVGCGDISATNPFDPATPQTQQATGSITGRLLLPSGFERSILDEARVRLARQDDPTAEPNLAELAPDDASDGALGLGFNYPEVIAGPYLLTFDVGPFQVMRGDQPVSQLPLVVQVGGRVDLGDLRLVEPAVASERGTVAGTAQRRGAAAHDGIRVEVRGTPYSVATTADGRFTLELPASAYLLDFSASGYAPVQGVAVTVAAGAMVQVPLQLLTGEPGALSGHLQLEAGSSGLGRVDTAVVSLFPASTPEDAPPLESASPAVDGRFSFQGLAPGEYRVRMALDGFAPALRQVAVSAGATSDVGDVELRPLANVATLLGVALCAGAPADGHGGIVVEVARTRYAAVTTSAGHFRLPVPADADGFSVRFGKAGYTAVSVDVSGLAAAEERVLDPVTLVGQPGSIAGSVRLPPGWPAPAAVADARIYRFAAAPDAGALNCRADADCAAPSICVDDVCRPPLAQLGTDATGRFVFSEVGAGDYLIGVRLDGFHPAVASAHVDVGGATLLPEISLAALPSTATITGTAQLLGAVDHSGITVTLAGAPLETTTGPDGRFRLAVPVRALGYTLRVSKAGYDAQEANVRGLGPAEVFELPEPIVLTGQPGRIRFVLELPEAFQDPDLIDLATIELSQLDAEGASRLVGATPAPHTGIVLLDRLAAGSYVIRVLHPSFETAFRSVLLGVGGLSDLGVVSLVTVGEAQRGLIRGRAQRGCPGACSQGGIRVEAALSPFVTLTNEDGDFELQAPENVYTLIFRATGYQADQMPEIPVLPQSVTELDRVAELSALPAGVAGRVLRETADGALAPAPEVAVTVRDGAGAVVVGRSAADGAYTLVVPTLGEYDVEFSLDAHQVESRNVQLMGGETLNLDDVHLALRRGRISGRVSVGAAAARLPGGATLRITGQPDDRLSAGVTLVTAAVPGDGTFAFERMAPGRYDLVAVAPELRPAPSMPVVVLPDAVTAADVQLVPRENALSVDPYTGDVATVLVTHDDDLGFARSWIDAPTAPPGLAFEPLAAARPAPLSVALPADGLHRIYVQLANEASIDGDAENDLLGTVTAPLVAEVVRDTSPPVVYSALFEDGDGFVRSPDGDVDAVITCADAQAPIEALGVTIRRDAEVLYDGPWQPALPLDIGVDEGPKTLEVTCRDPMGRVAEPYLVTVLHDLTPPRITDFELLDGRDDAATSDRFVDANIAAVETGSGLDRLEISLDPQMDCARVGYSNPFAAASTVSLPDADGPYRIYACLRDAAGNVSARAASNRVVLDTAAPLPGTLRLARGAAVVNSTDVEISIEAGPEMVSTLLSGDLDGPGAFGPGEVPGRVTLAAFEGLHVMTAVLRDAAGNESPPFSDVIELDRVAPGNGEVTLADGVAVVHARNVSVSIADTVADSMALTEFVLVGDCPDPDCGGPAFRPFASATAFTLSPGRGRKRVCWKFCDLAGNGSEPDGGEITLDSYLPRPRPVVAGSEPRNILPFDCDTPPAETYSITVTGRGFAADTRMQLGPFTLPCVSEEAADCQADADGGCAPGGTCERTCAEACTVDLPPFITTASASHVIRALTPDPVVGGEGTSADFALLDLVAPVPQIWFMSAQGATQPQVGDGYPGEILELEVTGCGFMDNTQFQLGSHVALVSSLEPDPDDPSVSTARLSVDTAEFIPSEVPEVFSSLNLAPGGGRADVPFGINPVAAPHLAAHSFPVGSTATPTADGRANAQMVSVDRRLVTDSVSFTEADAIATFTSPGGQMLNRFRRDPAGGVFPLSSVGGSAYRIDGTRPSAPFYGRPRRFAGGAGSTFDATVPQQVPPGLTALYAADFDGDHQANVFAVGPQAENPVWFPTGVGGPFGTARSEPAGGAADYIEYAFPDLNGDQVYDVIWWSNLGLKGYFRFARGGDDFERSPVFTVNTPLPLDAATIADVDGDALADAVVAVGPALFVRRGRLDARFSDRSTSTGAIGRGNARFVGTGAISSPLSSGRVRDVVVSTTADTLEIHRDDGAGHLEVAQTLPAAGCTRLAVADLDNNGLDDVAAVCGSQTAVLIWLNLGDGHLGPSQAVAVPAEPVRLEVADWIGDGELDLVVSLAGGAVTSVRRDPVVDPNGGFIARSITDRQTGESPSHALPMDLDGDGLLDLVHLGGDGLRVYYGGEHVNAAWVVSPDTIQHPAFLAGNFTHTSRTATGCSLFDFNRDNYTDLAVIANSGIVQMWMGSEPPDGPFHNIGLTLPNPNPGSLGLDVLVAELTGDARPELVETSSNGQVVIYVGSANILAAVPVRISTAPYIPVKLHLAVEPDGFPVLYATYFNEARIGRWFFNPLDSRIYALGTVSNLGGIPIGSGAATLARASLGAGTVFGDFDEDGANDIVTATEQPGLVTVRHNTLDQGTSSAYPDLLGAAGPIKGIAGGDLDGDSHLDLAVDIGAPGRLTFFYGRGDGTFEGPIELAGASQDSAGIRIVDLNGDGLLDLAQSYPTGLGIRLGAGRRTFEDEAFTATPTSSLRDLQVRGFSLHDGVPELAAVERGTGRLIAFQRAGVRTWAQEFVDLDRTPEPIPMGSSELRLHQARQKVEDLSVRVRIEGQGLAELSLSLRSPRGELVALEEGAARDDVDVWQASYPTVPAADDLNALEGWQPTGDWALVVENAGASAVITDFAVLTRGRFQERR